MDDRIGGFAGGGVECGCRLLPSIPGDKFGPRAGKGKQSRSTTRHRQSRHGIRDLQQRGSDHNQDACATGVHAIQT